MRTRSAGRLINDMNHTSKGGRINMSRVTNVSCINDVDKLKREQELAEQEESYTENEREEREKRRTRFIQPAVQAQECGGPGGIVTASAEPADRPDIVYTENSEGNSLRTRFKKPIDNNTER
jgi:hypothetical protein